ncbi:hypothetical protein, partial [Salmonella enterica]|uniref:hypothetical protein n=1 Tax=Salmonella enterica TaxID=28901 RepID=UPI0019D54839
MSFTPSSPFLSLFMWENHVKQNINHSRIFFIKPPDIFSNTALLMVQPGVFQPNVQPQNTGAAATHTNLHPHDISTQLAQQ